MPDETDRPSAVAELQRRQQESEKRHERLEGQVASITDDLKTLVRRDEERARRDEDRDRKQAEQNAEMRSSISSLTDAIGSESKQRKSQMADIESRRFKGWQQWAMIAGMLLSVGLLVLSQFGIQIKDTDSRLESSISANTRAMAEATKDLTTAIAASTQQSKDFARDLTAAVRDEVSKLDAKVESEASKSAEAVRDVVQVMVRAVDANAKADAEEIRARQELERDHVAFLKLTIETLANLKAQVETAKVVAGLKAEHADQLARVRTEYMEKLIAAQERLATRDREWFVREMDMADIQGQRDRLEQLHHLESLIYDMTPAQE